jgi:hypothetical protein
MSLLVFELLSQKKKKKKPYSLDPPMKLAILIVNEQPFYNMKTVCQKLSVDTIIAIVRNTEVPEKWQNFKMHF